MSFIERAESDALEFIARVEAIVSLAIASHPPAFRLVRINNWFGDRWVGFAGKVLGAAGAWLGEELVVPPFVPSRIVGERCYGERPNGGYVEVPCRAPLHISQTSENNLRRRVRTIAPNEALLWYSGNSATNGRGSVLAYVLSQGEYEAWYADLAAPSWAPRRLWVLPTQS